MEANFPHVLENTAHNAAFNPGPWRKDQLQGAGPTLGQAGELNGGGRVMPCLGVGGSRDPGSTAPQGLLVHGQGATARLSLFSEQPEPRESCGAPAS